jgi:hypothetical protein
MFRRMNFVKREAVDSRRDRNNHIPFVAVPVRLEQMMPEQQERILLSFDLRIQTFLPNGHEGLVLLQPWQDLTSRRRRLLLVVRLESGPSAMTMILAWTMKKILSRLSIWKIA